MRLPPHPKQLRDERAALERLLLRRAHSEPSVITRPAAAPPARSRPWLSSSATTVAAAGAPALRLAPCVVTLSLEEYIGSPAALTQAHQLYASCKARADDSRNQAALRAHARGELADDGPLEHYEAYDPPRATRTPIFGMPPVRPRGTRGDPIQAPVKGQYGHLVYDVAMYTNPKSQCVEPLTGNPRSTPIFSDVPKRVGRRGDVRYTGKETEVRGHFGPGMYNVRVNARGQPDPFLGRPRVRGFN